MSHADAIKEHKTERIEEERVGVMGLGFGLFSAFPISLAILCFPYLHCAEEPLLPKQGTHLAGHCLTCSKADLNLLDVSKNKLCQI
jgi:hypothetical protein